VAPKAAGLFNDLTSLDFSAEFACHAGLPGLK
jgi:hypothetical protein